MLDRAKALTQIDGQHVFICVYDEITGRIQKYQSDEKFDVLHVSLTIDRAAKKGNKSLRYLKGSATMEL